MWSELLYAAALVFGGILIGGGVMAMMAVGAEADKRDRERRDHDPWGMA